MDGMKDYEGPAFTNDRDNLKRPRFTFHDQETSSGKFTFEPAYKKESKPNKVRDENLQRNEARTSSEMSEPALSLDNYEIPFLKKRQQKEDRHKINISKEENSTEELVNSQEQQTERSNYKPSLTQKQEERPEEFKATQLPSPYKGKAKEMELTPRQLASRLRKSKESFLLFDK